MNISRHCTVINNNKNTINDQIPFQVIPIVYKQSC